MNIYGLQTARKPNSGVTDKNIMILGDKPLYKYNLEAANKCSKIKKTFISTNIPEIINNESNVIIRPENICNGSHYDAILHGLNEIEIITKESVDILVILLGNSLGANPSILEHSIEFIKDNETVDSVMSVGEYNMYNPYRSYKMTGSYLETTIPQEIIKENLKNKNSNDRDAFGNNYFFNGSFWITRKRCILDNNGLLPFPWLGKKIKAVIQSSSFMEVDSEWQTNVISELI